MNRATQIRTICAPATHNLPSYIQKRCCKELYNTRSFLVYILKIYLWYISIHIHCYNKKKKKNSRKKRREREEMQMQNYFEKKKSSLYTQSHGVRSRLASGKSFAIFMENYEDQPHTYIHTHLQQYGMVRQMVYSNINEAFFYADILTQIYRKDLRKKKTIFF